MSDGKPVIRTPATGACQGGVRRNVDESAAKGVEAVESTHKYLYQCFGEQDVQPSSETRMLAAASALGEPGIEIGHRDAVVVAQERA